MNGDYVKLGYDAALAQYGLEKNAIWSTVLKQVASPLLQTGGKTLAKNVAKKGAKKGIGATAVKALDGVSTVLDVIDPIWWLQRGAREVKPLKLNTPTPANLY